MSDITITSIHTIAVLAARKASHEAYAQIGDGYPCGFAWVQVFGVKLNTKAGKEFKALGFRKDYNGGISLWNPGGMSVQNVDVKEAGAQAYAQVLKEHGYTAYASSRLD